jgi:hypothetical protein
VSDTSNQSKGGHARAASLTPEERHQIASDAAKARWSETRKVLHIPTDRGFASIPFPLSESDFDLIMGTLALWKTKMTTLTVLEEGK